MNSVYKVISFWVIGFLLSYLSEKMQSTFTDAFAQNILALLTTLFAINIASSTLIAGKLSDIQDRTAQTFEKTKFNLRRSFYEQLVIIIIAFIATLLRESKVLQKSCSADSIHLYADAVLFGCFIYYVDIIRDLGRALFELLNFKK